MPNTRVYIDGFNLYHGLIRPNRLHWLDLNKFAVRLNRGQPVDRVVYCTAMVSGTKLDPDKSVRQDIYIRAVRMACPNVEVMRGQFTSHKALRALAGCSSAPTCAIRVSLRSEKGSDVNLASRLLHDAHRNLFDVAIVISGDSDLAEPIRLVVSDVGKKVWVRNPRNVHSAELASVATEYDTVKATVLRNSQLPDTVTDGNKVYSKPAKWGTQGPAAMKTNILAVPCTLSGCQNTVTTCRYV